MSGWDLFCYLFVHLVGWLVFGFGFVFVFLFWFVCLLLKSQWKVAFCLGWPMEFPSSALKMIVFKVHCFVFLSCAAIIHQRMVLAMTALICNFPRKTVDSDDTGVMVYSLVLKEVLRGQTYSILGPASILKEKILGKLPTAELKLHPNTRKDHMACPWPITQSYSLATS